MNLNYNQINLHTPFSLLRVLIPDLDALTGMQWSCSSLTRAVFHRSGRDDESLSERQVPKDQLRYYTDKRVLRGLRRIAYDYAAKIPEKIVLVLSSFPRNPDVKFLEWLVSKGEVEIEISRFSNDRTLISDKQSKEFNNAISKIKDGSMDSGELSSHLSQLLSYGDSWSGKLLADAYLGSVDKIDLSLTDILGISYALQGDTGMAKLLWEKWLRTSTIDEARARYSLSMLHARHHPRALLDPIVAEKHLEIAWEKLQGETSTPKIEYEKIFNRNGMALLLFRKKKFAEARSVLEQGIYRLQNSKYCGQLHHTVLTSNLARVVQSMGNLDEAEMLYRKAISMDPKFAEYHQDLASFLCDMGRFEEAAEEAEYALQLDPGMPEAYRLKGYIFVQLGKFYQARDCYAEAANLGDGDAVMDALRASYEAETPEWTVLFGSRVSQVELNVELKAEAELLLLQARSSIDPSLDFRSGLDDLKMRFPNDDLIAEVVRMNMKQGSGRT